MYLTKKVSYEIYFGKPEREGNLVLYSIRQPTTPKGVASRCTQEILRFEASPNRPFIPKLEMVTSHRKLHISMPFLPGPG